MEAGKQDKTHNKDATCHFNGPVALITGASSGIGVHYAKELAKRGYNIIIISNQELEIKKIAAEITASTGVESVGVYKDLAAPGAAEDLFALYPAIEVLVNNAGIFFYKDMIDCNMSRIETILNLHMVTVTKLCRLYGEQMRSAGKGYILNMSSISVHTPFPGISLYTATKSYIRTFSKAFHYEMKGYGVKVLIVSPGAVATDLYSLPANLQKLGIKLGVIYRPDKLAKRALDKLFNSSKTEFIPGVINRFFKPIYALLSTSFKMWVRKKTLHFMK
ncbi:MAG: SDR family NAD(P)-dependent oxidoreductase [Bacteroidales bacterium]